jgi:hypothetical protein
MDKKIATNQVLVNPLHVFMIMVNFLRKRPTKNNMRRGMLITQRFNDGKNASEIEKYFQLNKSVVSLVIKTYRVKSNATKKNKQKCIDDFWKIWRYMGGFAIREKKKVMCWPPQSPDLNPIENLWGRADKQIRAKNHSNVNDLFDALKEACLEDFGACLYRQFNEIDAEELCSC